MDITKELFEEKSVPIRLVSPIAFIKRLFCKLIMGGSSLIVRIFPGGTAKNTLAVLEASFLAPILEFVLHGAGQVAYVQGV